MNHDPEEQERPFVTWSKGKKDSDRIVKWVCWLLAPASILAIVYHVIN